MRTRRQILFESDGLMNLKSLVEVYEEVAASRMQKVRKSVLTARQFLQGLLSVFVRIRTVYKGVSSDFGKNLASNGRTVAVLITANSGLYGDIVEKTFQLFAEYVAVNKTDVVVLGTLGLKMMNERIPGVLYNYFDFDDDEVDVDSFDMIMRYLMQFEKIIVFHGQFRTIVDQSPVATSVSGDTIETEKIVEESSIKSKSQYIFEPGLTDIAKVFEGEILASLFEQTLHESQLAKFASRMLALDRSMENIDERIGIVGQELIKSRHRVMNRKQLSTIAGMTLWSSNVRR